MSTAMEEHFESDETPGFAEEPDFESPGQVKRKGMDKQGALILGVGALAICLAGFVLYKRHFSAPADTAQSPVVAEVAAESTPPAQPAALVTNAEIASSSPSSPASASQAEAASSLQAPTATAPAPVPTPTAPVQASPQPTMATPSPAADASKSNELEATKSRLKESERQLEAATSTIARLQAELKELKAQVAHQATAPKVVEASPAPVQKSQPTRQVKAPPAKQSSPSQKVAGKEPSAAETDAAAAIGRSRTDFRLYAMRDGQAWVQSLSTRETFPAVVGAMLPDGSKVTKIDEAAGKVSTTSGEIRYSPITRN